MLSRENHERRDSSQRLRVDNYVGTDDVCTGLINRDDEDDTQDIEDNWNVPC